MRQDNRLNPNAPTRTLIEGARRGAPPGLPPAHTPPPKSNTRVLVIMALTGFLLMGGIVSTLFMVSVQDDSEPVSPPEGTAVSTTSASPPVTPAPVTPAAVAPIHQGVWIANLPNAEIRDVESEEARTIRQTLMHTRATLTLHPAGRYEQTITVEGEPDDVTQGTYTMTHDGAELYTLTTTPSTGGTTNRYPLTFLDPDHFVMTNSQNGMTLMIPYSRGQ